MGTALHSGPDHVLRVLGRVEQLPADATGALAFGPEARATGVVLLERGRICWAAAQGLRRRLTDLLSTCCSPPMSAEEAEELFQACRRDGKPFGETLVAGGRVTPPALRAALLSHTVESLSAPAPWLEEPRWLPHRARGYQSAYTFLPSELLAHSSGLVTGVEGAKARLYELGEGRTAAAFDRAGILLACQLPESKVALAELRAAGTWARTTLSADELRSPVLKFAFDGRGGSWLAWREDGVTLVVHSAGRDDFSAAVRTLQRRGWTSAVHSSVPLS